jgi:hypothetical protein
MARISTTILFVAAFAVTSCVDSGYDKARYNRMQLSIDGSTNKLLGLSLTDASRVLSLKGARWDEGYTSVPLGQLRIYHFRGFYLLLSLEVRPQGITQDKPQPFSHSDLRSNGVWWVANFHPALHIDGLDEPSKRMTNYWDRVNAGFRAREEEMKRLKSKTNR